MDSGSSAPPAPDYVGAAKTTADGNLTNLNAQTAANRPNQVTPWGSSTWTNSKQFDQAAYDAALAKYTGTGTPGHYETRVHGGEGGNTSYQYWVEGTGPTGAAPTRNDFTTDSWTQNLTLTPEMQAALTDQQAIQRKQSGLAGTLQDQVASTMSGGFNGPSLDDYMGGVGDVKQRFARFNASGTPGVDYDAPQFSDATAAEGARHAYDASTALLKPQWEQDTKALDEKLRLQGLEPGTEAYNTAMQNLTRSQGQVQSQMADQAWQTGSGIARENYASALAGYGAKNTAQTQGFGQALAGYGANTTAQEAENQAQAQAWQQGQGGFNTAYQSALQKYLQPLNSMNAVLTGNQVSMPSMPSFATAGYTNGADMTGATGALGSWQQGLYNSSQAQAASNNSSMAGLASAAMMAYAMSDRRLKTNIRKLGTTRGGHNWYAWDWKTGPGSAVGVIAQEVPHAAFLTPSGYYAVDYSLIH